MRACYDLNKSPATHDFVNWLVRAEFSRRMSGEASLEIVIRPGDRRRTQRDIDYTLERKLWRARNLLFPISWCLPSVVNVGFGDGEQDLSYLNFPQPVPPVLAAPKQAKEFVRAAFPPHMRPVSISIRQSAFEPQRNSDISEWKRVAAWLSDRGFQPVFVPDAEAVMFGVDGSPSGYVAAAMSPEIRLALYERCEMNLITTSGPMVLALMSDISLSAWKIIVPGIQCAQPEHMRRSSMSEEDDWGPRKHLHWGYEHAEEVIAELSKEMNIQERKVA